MRRQNAAQVLAVQDAIPEATDPLCHTWWVAMLRIELELVECIRARAAPLPGRAASLPVPWRQG